MKSTKNFVKKKPQNEIGPVSGQLDDLFPQYGDKSQPLTIKNPREIIDQDTGDSIKLDPFDTTLLGSGIPNYVLVPIRFTKDLPPLATQDEIDAMNKFYQEHEVAIKNGVKTAHVEMQHTRSPFYEGEGLDTGYDPNADWIQTHSGRRFNPLKPNPNAIVIQDIAHSLSMLCRFTGHCSQFYSVAQHSVLVSYICGPQDALWGLLHDASESYLIDIPRPLKRSGKFQAYLDFEVVMQEAVCRRFGLPFQEPPAVKIADTLLLATEARDLMSPLHSDWQQPVDPLPFKIEPWDHNKSKDMFMKRFFELTTPGDSAKLHYEHYLRYRDVL